MNRKKQAKIYERIKLVTGIGETILMVVLLLIFVLGGYAAQVRDWSAQWTENPYLQLLLFVSISGAIFSFISMPFSFFSGYWLEHRFNLSNQSLVSFIWERTKSMLVGIVLMLPVLLVFYYFLRHFPGSWWLWTAMTLFLFSVIIGRIAPQFIFPIFYKFEKLDDPELLKRMEALAKQGRFHLQGIYRFNMSKTTRKANAAFTGLGKAKRIILGDTLLNDFSADEIDAVFAHEVGHYVHKHIWTGVLVSTASTFIGLYIAHIIYQWAVQAASLNGPTDLAALPLLSLILSGFAFISNPLSNALSRHNERQADLYALQTATAPQAFITAMQKLTDINLSDDEPHPVVEFFFHSHPAVSKRIRFAKDYLSAGRHTAAS